jgi:hypothetical protein
MRTYDFDLRLLIDGLTDDDAERLYEAVSDGTLSSCNGVCQASVTRRAKDLEAAVTSAIRDCKKAGYKARKWTSKDEEERVRPKRA